MISDGTLGVTTARSACRHLRGGGGLSQHLLRSAAAAAVDSTGHRAAGGGARPAAPALPPLHRQRARATAVLRGLLLQPRHQVRRQHPQHLRSWRGGPVRGAHVNKPRARAECTRVIQKRHDGARWRVMNRERRRVYACPRGLERGVGRRSVWGFTMYTIYSFIRLT